MQSMYLIANISRQGHYKEVRHEKIIAEKSIFYVGLMYKIREFHPGMGLRKMYEQFQPEGIGRDAWGMFIKVCQLLFYHPFFNRHFLFSSSENKGYEETKNRRLAQCGILILSRAAARPFILPFTKL